MSDFIHPKGDNFSPPDPVFPKSSVVEGDENETEFNRYLSHLYLWSNVPNNLPSLNSKTFRTYKSILVMTSILKSLPIQDHIPILYRVGSRYDNYEEMLHQLKETFKHRYLIKGALPLIDTTEEMRELLVTSTKSDGQMIVNPNQGFDFDGVIYRVVEMLCAYVNHEDVSSLSLSELSSNEGYGSIIPAHVLNKNMSEGVVDVYLANGAMKGLTFGGYQLFIAICRSLGSNVYAHGMPTDDEDNYETINQEGGIFAQSLWAILDYMSNLYLDANSFDRFCLILLAGLHSSTTVVAHTDEGGLTRDIFRAMRRSIAKPSGYVVGINLSSNLLAYPLYGTRSNICCFLDSLALASAAMVYPADIGGIKDNAWFPTVSSTVPEAYSSRYKFGDIKIVNDTQQRLMIHKNNLRTPYIRMMRNLVRMFTRYLGKETSMKNWLERFVSNAYEDSKWKVEHYNMEVVAPWYWVEPTTILNPESIILPVGKKMNHVIYSTYDGGSCSIPGFEDTVSKVTTWSTNYRINLRLTSLRKNPALFLDGMSAGDESGVYFGSIFKGAAVLPGASLKLFSDEIFEKGKSNVIPFKSAFWAKGDNGIPPPAEFNYLGGIISIDYAPIDYGIPNRFEGLRVAKIRDFHDIRSNILTVGCRPAFQSIDQLGEENTNVARHSNEASSILKCLTCPPKEVETALC
ncbi:uncharacterized protein KGF55_005551 [Candida pseudojiufengensis]|uniref:uncharacterized protein n=1 Tax=Candida pseudojiufengensis TaxID=497109 RepID=UPI002224E436|nr:uncharacterized protein KGF55_005551 [Candida pseudojiufengensis]KAI5959061.1 hypothetical protein KGF55_005551 [Candida pseudojiufengensis]